MKKFKIVTLGCRTNQYESQAYRDQLIKMGWVESTDTDPAEICIVNTCTVTESADQSSRSQIKQLSKKNPDAKIYVTGCLAERAPKEMALLPQVDKVVSNLEKESLLQLIFPDESVPEFAIEQFEAHTRAFVKVQDGCNSFCSYCVIPYVRGRSRSKKIEPIIQEVKALIQNGYKEVVLTGINIGDFDGGVTGDEPPIRLHELVTLVDQIDGLKRLRISSIDPDEVDENLLNAVIHGKNTCPSMHIVLQAGSNTVLKRMNRKYTKQQFYDSVTKLKTACPDFTFTTDVIVGFPGETEQEFEETLEVIQTVKFAKVHMFPFSVRPGTRAARMTNQLPYAVIQERKERVLRLAEKVAFELRNEFLGRIFPVLIEGKEDDGEYLTGHTPNFLPVLVPKQGIAQNTIVNVKLIQNTPKGCIGEIVQ
jgi:threonylcarbamoyladenosine tRNA methylthiotransferase MtaB